MSNVGPADEPSSESARYMNITDRLRGEPAAWCASKHRDGLEIVVLLKFARIQVKLNH
jgi:hypothetical protein